jgi:hypothetical protein
VDILKYKYETSVLAPTFVILRMHRQFRIVNYLDKRKVNENLGEKTK